MAQVPGFVVIDPGLAGSPVLNRSTGRYGPYTRPLCLSRVRKPGAGSDSGAVGGALAGRAPAPSATICTSVLSAGPGPIKARPNHPAPLESGGPVAHGLATCG